jgi:hypothetical protein
MRRRVFIVIAIGGGLALALAIVMLSGVIRFGASARCSYAVAPVGAGPLPGGKLTTVARAQSIAGYPIPLPNVAAARPANLTQAWANGQRTVAQVFAAGKITIMLAPASYPNALAHFRQFIAQNHAAAAIEHVRGQPALVITAHTDACGSNPAWVEFDQSGADINIYSSTYGTGTLLSVAGSLRPRTPWPPR